MLWFELLLVLPLCGHHCCTSSPCRKGKVVAHTVQKLHKSEAEIIEHIQWQ